MAKKTAAPAIRLRGVRHNNLKNFDLDLPLGRLIVVTGPSGSGKSSLAFDTLFAEGQRRYIETFSPYARQFFDRMDKPQVDRIEGIPPAIAIEQRNSVKTTRSTVGTLTELCDYLKLLWPHLARLHCRGCGQPVRKEPPQFIWSALHAEFGIRNPEFLVTFDLPLSQKLSVEESLALIAKQGYQRLLLGDDIVRLDEAPARAGHLSRHTSLTIIQDRLRLVPENRARFVEACEQAYHFGKGKLAVRFLPTSQGAGGETPPTTLSTADDSTLKPINRATRHFSAGLHCAQCDQEYRDPSPALFSFNHPMGACPTCKGFGRVISIDYHLALPDRGKTLAQGAVRPWQSGFSAECQGDLRKFCKVRGVPMNVPFRDLPPEQQRWVIEGDPDYGIDDAHEWPYAWYGVKGYFKWLESKAYKMHVRVLLSRYRAYSTCPDCQGQRFNPDSLLYRCTIEDLRWTSGAAKDTAPRKSYIAYRESSLTLADFYALPIDAAEELFKALATRRPFQPSDPLALILEEIRARLGYLVEVGLGYLTLDRPMRTLSGGETERVSLTTCLGTRLVNTLYVLDEPSVGLHARDTARLVRILERLRDLGNTVVVVEHEAGIIRAADHVVDLGPGSGEAGGQLVFQGSFEALKCCAASLTGLYLCGKRGMEQPPRRAVAGPKSETSQTELSSDALREVAVPYQVAGVRGKHPARPSDFGLRTSDLNWLTVHHASRHNLKNLSVAIPLNRFVCLTGVSGSGKTTLVREVLLPTLQAKFGADADVVKASDRLADDNDAGAEGDDASPSQAASEAPGVQLAGDDRLGGVMLVDQSPLGKTPRSNPVVYIGAFDAIRDLFAKTEMAVQRGLNSSAFSFNSAQGQCERCRGAGFEKIEMQFLSDVFIRCPDCDGRRYRTHILEVKLPVAPPAVLGRAVVRKPVPRKKPQRGKSAATSLTTEALTTDHWSIADVLEATADDALAGLAPYADTPAGRRALEGLRLLQEVGLGYLRLGQPINTLSGGESQRLKLVSHLAEASHRDVGVQPSEPKTLFLFDEPTTGLHFDDVRVLLKVFQRLVEAGHSVLVIEHNLDVIRAADWIIDLGPEAGDRGGELVVAGTPETVAACEASHTGRALREMSDPSRTRQ